MWWTAVLTAFAFAAGLIVGGWAVFVAAKRLQPRPQPELGGLRHYLLKKYASES